jgi:hypothetical protein
MLAWRKKLVVQDLRQKNMAGTPESEPADLLLHF